MIERDIFTAALNLGVRTERTAYLKQVCGPDAALRQRVETLLAEHEQLGSFMEGNTCATAECSTIERIGTRIGPYRLLQQIGEGGMGVVYMAEQTEPVRRRVAIKIIKPGMDTRQVIARFEAERQALAMMDHANIARVLDAGTTDQGRPYFVMELVHGVPITQYCDTHRVAPRQRLELFVPVCQAIQHAHQKGIIHRDIKPTNVMVTLYDGQPVAKVIDFGVAKATEQSLTERTLFTQYGTMIGTLEYMSPEQAEMSALGVDTRSDIYSLGVLLYELLTGSTPLVHKRVHEAPYADVLRMIKEEEPPTPSTRLSSSGEALASISAQRQTEPAKLTKLVRGELDWIVMKCLEKDRNRRYGTVQGLVADVQRYLSDETVLACPPSALYRFRKFARRNKAALATASALVLAVLVMIAGLTSSLYSLVREQEQVQKAWDNEKLVTEVGRRNAYFQSITLANHELSINNFLRARRHLLGCPPDLQKWEWRYLQRLCRFEPLVLRDTSEVNGLAFSPTDDRLASGNNRGEIVLWELRTGREVHRFQAHTQSVVSIAFHSDGKHLASVGLDGQAKVWDLFPSGDAPNSKPFCQPCDAVHRSGTSHAVAFAPGIASSELAIGSGGVVQIWDWRSSRLLSSCPGHQPRSVGVAFSSDGRNLATGDWRGMVRLWNPRAGSTTEPVLAFTKSPEVHHPAPALAFSPSGSRLAAVSFNRRVDVWETATGKAIHTLKHSDGLVTCVAYSPCGERIVSSGEDKVIHIWDAETGREVLGLRGHRGQVGCVAFSRDGHRLASASMDKTIRIWDATPLVGNEAQELLTYEGHDHEIWTLAVSPQGDRVVSAGFSTPAKIWDIKTGSTTAPDFAGHGDVTFGVAWHPSGQRVASAGSLEGNFTFTIFEVATARDLLPPLVPVGREFFNLTFCPPDGHFLLTGRADGTVQIWDAQTGELQRTLIHGDMVRGLTFSRKGQEFASLSWDGVVKVWPWDAVRIADPAWKCEPRQLAVKALVPGPCASIDFSPDGRLAIGTEDSTVQIWDVAGDKLLTTLRGHSDDVYAVAFSPEPAGRLVATAGADSTVKVWNSLTGELVHNFRGHTGLVTSLAFTPDGSRLVSGSRDHTAKVWDMTPLGRLPDD